MRQVYIDLTTDNARLPSGNFIGYLGEHNATELLISIPQAMVDASDFQVLVLQSGPMVFKTKHITENSSPTYRDGNTIHTKLSKNLTTVSNLSLQVECYKENGDGEPTLIGKTQTVTRLILKPSPEGFPAFNYDGSFEDIEGAIEKAHKHSNMDVLDKFSVSGNGTVMFDGKPIDGIEKYANPSSLPDNVPIGTLALALNDDELVFNSDGITAGKNYKYLKLKDNINLEDFSIIRYVLGGSSSSELEAGFVLKDKNDNYAAQMAFLHFPSYEMSFMALIDMGTFKLNRAMYNTDALFVNGSDSAFLIFNPYKPFDFGAIATLSEPAVIDKGWHFVYSQRTNPTINQYMNINYSEIAVINDDKYWFDNYHIPYEDVTIECDNSYVKEYTDQLLSAVFERADETPDKKGLYIFTDNGWQSVSSVVKAKSLVVNSVADLPLDAETGTVAYAANNAYLFGERHFNLYKNSTYSKFYLPPVYDDFALLYDFSVVIEMWRHLDNGDAKYGDAINIVTNKDQKYFVLEAHSTKAPYDRHLIYSWEDQTIEYNGNTSFEVKKGWNEITPYYSPNTVKQITFDELPEFNCENSGSLIPPYYKVITMETTNWGPQTSMPMYHFSTAPYGRSDSGKGLWIKTQGEWKKLTDTDKYILEEE